MASVVFRLSIDTGAQITFVTDDQGRGIGEEKTRYGNVMLMGRNNCEAANESLLVGDRVELKAVKSGNERRGQPAPYRTS
jgi:hypothetical protein